ncbi:MAG: helix-turn-helix domain-containing protein [Gammaproteobacteria bacterium]|nr:helix-turn-helix domain-containing protein [Gammaproteobacteria bacterium]MDH5802227.1 helix-turn-helix domain-containing protein [Gammaproteobacteria bacterium]
MGDSSQAVWRALNDSTRRQILDLLRDKPRTTGELSEILEAEMSRFAVMKHLKVLQESRLISIRRQGRQRWNYLNAIPLQQIYDRWMKPYEALWAENLLRVKHLVERKQEMSDSSNKKVDSIRIAQDVLIHAKAEKVFKALVNDMGAWWGLPYLRNPHATNIVLEPRVGGVMKEVWGDENGVEGAECARVISFQRNTLLELSGRFGLDGAVMSVARFELEEADGATTIKFSHHIIGDVDQQVREMYQFGWKDLLATRLRRYVEQGERYGVGHPLPPGLSFPNLP